jgi:transposase
MISVPHGSTLLGLDVHKLTIAAGVLVPDADVAVVDQIASDQESVRRFVGRFTDRHHLVACYEAGPTGYELARDLRAMGVRCEVVAPSLIPVAPGNKVKSDKRDARRLALLLRAGQLSAVRVPSVVEEAVRDLCRARADMVIDRSRARHRLSKFLLRHGRVWRGGDNWTMKHVAWMATQRFTEPALDATLAHYRATLAARDAAHDAIDTELATWFEKEPFTDAVHRLSAYRGVTQLGALTLASEVCDWHRFPTAGSFGAFCGLVPMERSSGERTWCCGITHAGNAHLRAQLVEPAWSYKAHPAVGATLRRRQEGLDPAVVARAWRAQLRLCGRFRRLDQRKSNRKTVVTAIARELASFVWAEMTAA